MAQEEIAEVVESQEPEAKQQYEGDDISALVTAKQRMAERDAEYASKFAAFAEKPSSTPSKPPRTRAAKPVSDPNYSNEGRSVPAPQPAVASYSNEGRSVPVAKESAAPYSNEGRSVPSPVSTGESAAVTKEAPSPTSYNSVKNGTGIKAVRNATPVQGKDAKEYASAWKQFK